MVFAETCYGVWLRAKNTITIIRDVFYKGRFGATKKGATFKYSLKKTIKTIYFSLILLFIFMFIPRLPDSHEIIAALIHRETV